MAKILPLTSLLVTWQPTQFSSPRSISPSASPPAVRPGAVNRCEGSCPYEIPQQAKKRTSPAERAEAMVTDRRSPQEAGILLLIVMEAFLSC